MPNLDWSKLPDTEKIKSDIKREFEYVGNIREDKQKLTLYQFSLDVLCRMYYWLQDSIPGVNDDKAVSESAGRVPPPDDKESENYSLRAIAYFSWEKERHTFLIRRVYPMSFDFLSYSHVPDGWGALGKMRAEIVAENRSYICVEDVMKEVLLLPYLGEAERLKYSSVLAAPVRSEQDLVGAFVFYLKDKEALPTEDLSLKFDAISSAMATAVQKHLNIITTKDGNNLPKIWRGFKLDSKENSTILELIISVKFRGKSKPNNLEITLILDNIATSVLGSLNTDDTFTILDKSSPTTNSIIFLTIGKEIDVPNLRRQILSAAGIAIGEICRENENLFFQLNCALPPNQD